MREFYEFTAHGDKFKAPPVDVTTPQTKLPLENQLVGRSERLYVIVAPLHWRSRKQARLFMLSFLKGAISSAVLAVHCCFEERYRGWQVRK